MTQSRLGCPCLTSELQNVISSNERSMADLKQLSMQLQQRCSEPCKDSVEIQPITGAGKHSPWPSGRSYFIRSFSIGPVVSTLCPCSGFSFLPKSISYIEAFLFCLRNNLPLLQIWGILLGIDTNGHVPRMHIFFHLWLFVCCSQIARMLQIKVPQPAASTMWSQPKLRSSSWFIVRLTVLGGVLRYSKE